MNLKTIIIASVHAFKEHDCGLEAECAPRKSSRRCLKAWPWVRRTMLRLT